MNKPSTDPMIDDYNVIIDSINTATEPEFDIVNNMIEVYRRKYPQLSVNADELERKLIARVKTFFKENPALIHA